MIFYGVAALEEARATASLLLGAPGSPDLTEIELLSFGIEESRSLKERAAQKPAAGDAQVFLIQTRSISVPAQNALLKLLEEPQQGTHFFFVVPAPERLLKTVLSRVRVRYVPGDGETILSEAADRFLRGTAAQRIKQVESFYNKPEKDRVGAEQFVLMLEQALYAKLHTKQGTDRAVATKLGHILAVRGFCSLPSSSPKLILEHLALVL
jgi:hypothetical protein